MMDKNQREKLFEIARKISEPCYNIMILAYENTEEQAASQNEKRLLTWALNKEVIPYLGKAERDKILMMLKAYENANYKKAKAFRILKDSGNITTKITNSKSFSFAFKQRLRKYEHLFNKEFVEDFF